jgi:hypothetical protein
MTGRRGEFIAACSIKTAKKNYMWKEIIESANNQTSQIFYIFLRNNV